MSTIALERASDRSRVLSQAVAEASKRLKVNSTELGAILGFSQPTSSRLLNQKYAIPEDSKEWELSAHFVRLYRSLSSLVGGDDELAKDWLTSPNRAFNQQTPISYIKRVDGLIHACEYLDAHRAIV
ncbi:MAG: antitoxin Xre/MbcA/ParS toxin-binding domain-containing protein [Methylophilaceae bacterium]